MTPITNIRTEGEWPRFTGLHNALVPDWIARSVDEIVAAHGDRLRSVYIDLYAHYYHDDNSNIDRRGYAGLSWIDHQDAPSEDELDHIPAMRRIERCAVDIWENAPFDADEEGNTNGEFGYHFTRDGFEYSWDRYEFTNEPDYSATAVMVDGEWQYEERIRLYDYEISETTLAINDTAEILEQISADDLGLSTMPDISALAHEYDEDCEALVIIAKDGGLFEHHEPSVV